MDPAEQSKLLLEVALLERHDESHETNSVQHKTDHSVIGGEGEQLRIGENHML